MELSEISPARWFLSSCLVAVGVFLMVFMVSPLQRKILKNALLVWLKKEQVSWTICIGIFTLGIALLLYSPSKELTIRLLPTLICSWLVGIEIIIVGKILRIKEVPRLHHKPEGKFWIGLISIGVWVLAAGLPSGLPGLFNGLPWNNSIEFAFLLIVLPIAILINWKLFTRKWVLFGSVFILFLKLFLFLWAPQSGFEIKVYKSPEAVEENQWERSYETLITKQGTTVMTSPYFGYLNFPIEWTNEIGLAPESQWFGMEFKGYINLSDAEQFLIESNAAREGWITMTHLETGKKLYGTLSHQTKNILKIEQPLRSGVWDIHGFVSYQGGDITFQPKVKSNGFEIDALEKNKIWQSLESILTITSVQNFWRFIAILFDISLISIILIVIAAGLWDQVFSGLMTLMDAYIISSGGFFFFLFQYSSPDKLPQLAVIVITILFIFQLTQGIFRHTHTKSSNRGLLLVLAVVLLSLFLSLDISKLQNLTIFPQGQDNLEYQIKARQIFVEGDFLLKNSPPRAYKMLFPYLVGGLHLLFGQSSAAQLLCNVWAAILTAWLIFVISDHLESQKVLGLSAAFLSLITFLSPMFYIYYFRFGLIEPLATCLLLFVFNLALRKKYFYFFLCGVMLSILRFDYLGAAFTAISLSSTSWIGAWENIFSRISDFIKTQWKIILLFGISLAAAPIIITAYYRLTIHNYVLNASDTWQTSFYTISEGIIRLITGGTWIEVSSWLKSWPLETILMLIILYCGIGIAFLALLRTSKLKILDLRWTFIIFGLLSVYLFVRPTGYSPRFSTPLIVVALLALSDGFTGIYNQQVLTQKKPS
ncbi:MAG: hypothetical protein JEZ06_09615 [Anaerolineaceae bacterium]|nr:hypothetical protein [Anaerolineaceae bacterium]